MHTIVISQFRNRARSEALDHAVKIRLDAANAELIVLISNAMLTRCIHFTMSDVIELDRDVDFISFSWMRAIMGSTGVVSTDTKYQYPIGNIVPPVNDLVATKIEIYSDTEVIWSKVLPLRNADVAP